MKLSNFAGEKSFTIGVISAVLFLYSMSIYSIFSEQDSSKTPDMQVATAEVKSSTSDDVKILRVVNTDEAGLFRPINTGEALWVPGAECTITNFNLAPDGSLYGVPNNCTFTLRGDR